MIIQEELSATLDEPTDCLMMHRVEPSRLQMIALNFTDKLQQLADNNEQVDIDCTLSNANRLLAVILFLFMSPHFLS